jgi:hypothetical protein
MNPTMRAGWANSKHSTSGIDYDYLTLNLRWTDELHEELGRPAFVRVDLSADPSGNVYATMVPHVQPKRQEAWVVKPLTVREEQWWTINANLRNDLREDARFLSGCCELCPAEGWVSNGVLVCRVIEVIAVGDDDDPKPQNGAVLPFDEADDQTPQEHSTEHLRPAWAHVRLLQKELARVEEARKRDREYRETILARDAQSIRSTEEFRAQVLQHSNRQTTALESIATSLKNMGTATGPTYAAIKALVYLVANATHEPVYANAYQDLREQRGGANAETETDNQE